MVSEQKKILILWSPLADYTLACFRKLALKKELELYIIYQAGENDAPYKSFELDFFIKAQVFKKENKKELETFCLNLSPDFILMASWNYKFYMSIAKKSKKKGTYVISTFDGQWRRTLKQRFGIFISPFFLKPAINNFFVPGDRQANFARRLGYKSPLQGYYCANTERFKYTPGRSKNRFIYVGRLVSIKGIDNLVKAYKEYRNTVAAPWDLVICGTGNLEPLFADQEGIELKGFIQPDQLPDLLSESKCLILPSYFEPWGLVIQEAAISGLAIICSYHCGASTMFVREGQNGYIINPDMSSLAIAMKKISDASDEQLQEMSESSNILGSLWTIEKWANYLYQNLCVVKKHQIV